MPKPKPKVSSRRLTINLPTADPDSLSKGLGKDELESFGLYAYEAEGVRGFTIGTPLQPREHRGEGLPELGDNRGLIDQWNLNLDIRVSYDGDGKTYLEIARPGSGTFHRFEFGGIEFDEAIRATGKFNNRFETFLIYYGLSPLFSALYRSRHSEKKDRLDTLETLKEHYENVFKSILNPKRTREIESREMKSGIQVTNYERIESGREPQTKDQKEREKADFIHNVYCAFRTLDQENRKRSQYNVAVMIFDGQRSKARKELEKAIGNRLRKFELRWKQLKADSDAKTPKK